MRAPAKGVPHEGGKSETCFAERRSDAEITAELIQVFEIEKTAIDDFKIGIATTITLLRTLDQERGKPKGHIPIGGWRADNLKWLAALSGDIERLEATLSQAPPDANYALFSSHPDPFADFPPEAAEQRRTIERAQWFASVMASLRRRCDHLIEAKLGTPRAVHYRKYLAAEEAYHFLNNLGKNPTPSEDGLFTQTTRLFYEAMTGEMVEDMQRICAGIIKTPPRIRGPTLGRGRIPCDRPKYAVPEDAMIDSGDTPSDA
jgi:hypothetical protein